ncbi:MAG: class I SAM-dependent methyltransferase [Candidatus Pacebacteria bacterium]|nr:class I SAM-dependent methyltransferase [Candidatus Paceibacterota bacterium]
MDIKQAYSLIEETKKAYDLIAPCFHQSRQILWPEIEDLKDLFSQDQNQNVLDFGCGNGRFYSLIQDKNINYYGADISKNLINLAKKQVPKGKFTLIDSDLKLPYPNDFFDYVVSIAVLHHVPSENLRQKLILEFKRVLKISGVLIITVWDFYHGKNLEYLNSRFEDSRLEKGDLFIPWKDNKEKILTQRFFHAFTMSELKTLIIKSGFKIKDLKLVPHNNKKEYFNILLIGSKPNSRY